MQFKTFAPPDHLTDYVECFRSIAYSGNQEITVRVCPNGFPGIAFHHHLGGSVITSIQTTSSHNSNVPTLFLYGLVTELSVMRFAAPFVTMQVILKPSALARLWGYDPVKLVNSSLPADQWNVLSLNETLIAATTDDQRVQACSDFLGNIASQAVAGDVEIEECLEYIAAHISTVDVGVLCRLSDLSERQFERRFKQVVGVSPHLYIRIKRINSALQLMQQRRHDRLVDIAHVLDYHDQSHFIHEIKKFSGLTPTGIQQRVEDFYQDQVGSSYLLTSA